MSLTPHDIETQLTRLSEEIEEAHQSTVKAESLYADAKGQYELKMARERTRLSQTEKLRVQDIQDNALLACSEEYTNLLRSEQLVKVAKSLTNKINTQVDIVRSQNTSVRASIAMQ